MKLNNQKEDIFHYAWATKKFDFLNLITTSGDRVIIHNFGVHNRDAGPDFLHAEVTIDNQKWVGNIEIHTRSSDWYNHKHHLDPNYNSVVLHVAYEHDKDVLNEKEQHIPSIELKGIIESDLFSRYKLFKENPSFIPCEQLISKVDQLFFELYKEDLIVSRFEEKTNVIDRLLLLTNNDWNEVAFRFLCRCLGGNHNQDAFETLATSCPINVISKHLDHPNQVYALLFGQAGFLNKGKGSFFENLQNEYAFLKTKYRLQSMPLESWNFARMRPTNFPTLRIAYLAEFILKQINIIKLILDKTSIEDLHDILKVQLPTYWDTHYMFTHKAKTLSVKGTTQSFIDRLLINAIIPFKFYYARFHQDVEMQTSAIDLLRCLKPEKNKILISWKGIGQKCKNALDSQALLHLYKNNCNLNNCLHCKVGHVILSK